MSLNFLTFNQDSSYLAVATSKGPRLFTTDPLSKYFDEHNGNISMLEMLFSTSLVALVLSPRRLQIMNTKRLTTICELTFPRAILAVRMNRKRLMVLLQNHIYLYDIQTMKLLYTLDTSPNPQAICALAPSSDNCYLAYPLPQPAPSPAETPQHAPPGRTALQPTTGDLLIFDAVKLDAINVVRAHRSPLACMTFNSAGTLLATASDKGTIIRVFSVPSGRKLHQFRRGSMPTRIFSMAFNPSSTLLCVSSATDTIHVFKLGPQPVPTRPYSASLESTGERDGLGSGLNRAYSTDSAISDTSLLRTGASGGAAGPSSDIASRRHNGTLMGILRRTSQNVGSSLASKVGGYLPRGVAEMWEPERDFAWLKLPKAEAVPEATPENDGTAAASSASSSLSPDDPASHGHHQQAESLTGSVVSRAESQRPVKTVVAINSQYQVLVATGEGHYYVYEIDLVNGGEGRMVRQHNWILTQSQAMRPWR